MFWGAKKNLKIFKKYFSNRIENLHKMAFIYYIFFLKKFEKVEKTGIISTKFSLRCTPSVILGCIPYFTFHVPRTSRKTLAVMYSLKIFVVKYVTILN